jgi:glyoxylate/hydroxypyruvate reductase
VHIHIQNRPTNSFVSITREMVDAAMGSSDDRFSISDTDDGFAAAHSTMDVLVTTADQIQLRFPCETPRLKAAFLLHAGLNGLDAANPLPEPVMLLNNSGAHARKAGEYVVMAALMLVNNMALYADQQRHRLWRPRLASTLAGRRVSILGVGGLGAGAARALRPFGVHLTGIRTSSTPHEDFDEIVPMDDLVSVLGRTDLLVLAAPLTQATRGLLGRVQLAALPVHAGLINIGRGEVVDQAALLEALHNEQLAGAVLDVQEVEPVPEIDPLWTAPNLILTPHVSATDSEHFGRDTLAVLRTNLEALARGERPPNLVDLRRGY